MGTKETYDFGEKETEFINGKNLKVTYHTAKYKEAKKKATELLNSEEYKDVLEPSDFWILVNTWKQKTEAMYSGLIISHDGCMKINDKLPVEKKFKAKCMGLDKDGYNNSLVFYYICEEQGLYEVGEVSQDNCKSDYPYAMALKRCFDRVVLKNSRIAYSGIYSDSEIDDFKKDMNDISKENEKASTTKAKENKDSKGTDIPIQESQIEIIKKLYTPEELKPLMEDFNKKYLTELTLLEASSLIQLKNREKEK